MRFNVVTVPEETALKDLLFTQTEIKALKAAGCTTVGDVLYAFSNRSIFGSIADREIIYEIALTICNPELTDNRKTFRFVYLNEESVARTQLNAALLMLSEEAQRVLKRFMVTIPEQLGYVLNESELREVEDIAYQPNVRVYEILDRILRSIDDLYFPEKGKFEVIIRGKFAAETYNIEIKDVFQEGEFKKFRQYCDDIGAVWIENLAGFSPDSLRESIGADQGLIDSVTERCKRIEQGDAKRFSGPTSYKSKLNSKAKKAALERHRRSICGSASERSLYGENELVRYTFIEPVVPAYMLTGIPLSFSNGYDVFMCNGWKDLLIKVLCFLCNEYPAKMEKLVEEKICNSQPALLYRNNKADMLSFPVRVTPLIVAETDFSNDAIYDLVKTLISKCKIPTQDFSITCLCSLSSIIGHYPERSNNSRRATPEEFGGSAEHHLIAVNFSKRRTEFEAWLKEEKSYSYTEVQECVTSVNTASDWARAMNISAEDFFDMDDTYQLIQCCEELMKNREFTRYERSVNNYDYGAVEMLIEFCMDVDTYEDTEADEEEFPDFSDSIRAGKNPNEKELMFERWLSNSENLDEIQTERCIEALYVAGDWARKLSITTRNLFEIKNAGELVRVTDALLANSQFSEYDTSMKQVFTKAIDMLVDYYYDQE